MAEEKRYWKALIALGLFLVLLQVAIPRLGDDAYFASQSLSIEWLSFRYHEWSSRVVIEAVLVWMSQHMWLFRICTSTVVILLLDSLACMTWGRTCRTLLAILVLGLSFPVTLFISAGWVATSLNYLWPIGLALFVWVHSRMAVPARRLALFVGLLVFAANQEQVATVLFVAFALSSVEAFLHYRDRLLSDLVLAGVAAIQFLVALLAPGNAVRSLQTATANFPEFLDYSIWDKLQLGISNVGKYLFFQQHILGYFFLLLLAVWSVWKRSKYIPLAILPLAIFPINTLMASLWRSGYTSQSFTEYLVNKQGNPLLAQILTIVAKAFTQEVSVVWNGVFLVFIMAVSILLYTFEKRYELPLLWLAGISSYTIMGFSPSIFMSGDRPAFILYLLLLIVVLRVLKQMWLERS